MPDNATEVLHQTADTVAGAHQQAGAEGDEARGRGAWVIRFRACGDHGSE